MGGRKTTRGTYGLVVSWVLRSPSCLPSLQLSESFHGLFAMYYQDIHIFNLAKALGKMAFPPSSWKQKPIRYFKNKTFQSYNWNYKKGKSSKDSPNPQHALDMALESSSCPLLWGHY